MFIKTTNSQIQARDAGNRLLQESLLKQMGEQYNQLVKDYEKKLYAIKNVLEQRFKEQPNQEVPKNYLPSLVSVGGGVMIDSPYSRQENRKFINTGEMNFTGSTLNLGKISGDVANTINQLPPDPASDQLDIKELLSQLQAAIEEDADLRTEDKADLLEQVKALAEAKQTPNQQEKKGLARKAKKMFDATLHLKACQTQLKSWRLAASCCR